MSSSPGRYCEVGSEEEALLGSAGAPIVLLGYKGGLAPSIAPGLRELGVMLPYTPLHHLLLHDPRRLPDHPRVVRRHRLGQ